MPELLLRGLRTRPLARYLAALGVLRSVARQVDKDARGRWTSSGFELSSALDSGGLLEFFCNDWSPSPVFTPWNGGGGYFRRADKSTGARTKETTATKNLARVEESNAVRLESFRRAIHACREALAAMELAEAPSREAKQELLVRLRDTLPEPALDWLDAAVLVGEQLHFPALLGSGGNDGNLDFSGNAIARLLRVMDPETGTARPNVREWLAALLFDHASAGLPQDSQGQFDPAGSGGLNQGAGFDGRSVANPWDFLLLLEGSLAFAVIATRRLESHAPGTLSAPFSVRTTAVGSAANADGESASSRNEQWFPVWENPARFEELATLLGEGRAQLARRPVVNALDFARAVGSLGVSRGIAAFERFGYQQRNGKAYYATPLGRWEVRRRPSVDLIDGPLDQWLDRFFRRASDDRAPASLARARRRIQTAMFGLANSGAARPRAEFIRALADAEQLLGHRPRQREGLRPVPALDRRWVDDIPWTPESALAMALAGSRLRRAGHGVDGPTTWLAEGDSARVWTGRDLIRDLTALARCKDVDAMGAEEQIARRAQAPWEPLARLLLGEIDERELDGLARAFSLLRSVDLRASIPPPAGPECLPPGFLMVALAFHRRLPSGGQIETLPQSPGLLGVLRRGDGTGAVRIAVRRLRSAGVRLRVPVHPVGRRTAVRWAAGLAFGWGDEQARLALEYLSEPAPNPPKPQETAESR